MRVKNMHRARFARAWKHIKQSNWLGIILESALLSGMIQVYMVLSTGVSLIGLMQSYPLFYACAMQT